MKRLYILFLVLSYSITAMATAEIKSTVKTNIPTTVQFPQPKRTFVQKIAHKILEKKLKYAPYTAKKDPDGKEEFKNDKHARLGFWLVIGGSLLGALISSLAIAALSYLISLAVFVGFILCVIALANGSLSPKGKRLAWWGVGIFTALIILSLAFFLIVLSAFV